jgi:hypothetical protein
MEKMFDESQMTEHQKRRGLAAAVLILLGLSLFLLRLVEGSAWALLFFPLGALLIGLYLYRRLDWYLVSGCIFLGIGLGSIGERISLGVGNFSAVGLGTGFIAIYVVHLIHERKSAWWPLVPGLILVIGGIASASRALAEFSERAWPLLFVVAGLIVWFVTFRPHRKGKIGGIGP